MALDGTPFPRSYGLQPFTLNALSGLRLHSVFPLIFETFVFFSAITLSSLPSSFSSSLPSSLCLHFYLHFIFTSIFTFVFSSYLLCLYLHLRIAFTVVFTAFFLSTSATHFTLSSLSAFIPPKLRLHFDLYFVYAAVFVFTFRLTSLKADLLPRKEAEFN